MLNVPQMAEWTEARCTTCDAFACAVGAKNDVATRVIPTLVARGMTLRADTVATRLIAEGGRIQRC